MRRLCKEHSVRTDGGDAIKLIEVAQLTVDVLRSVHQPSL